MKCHLISLILLLLNVPLGNAQEQKVRVILQGYLNKTDSSQDSLILGKQFQVSRNALLMNGVQLKRLFQIKMYDRKNWLLKKYFDNREIAIGHNKDYMFVLEKQKTGQWKQSGIAWKPGPNDIQKNFFTEFEALNPLVSLSGQRFLHFLEGVEEVRDFTMSKGDFNELRFETIKKGLNNEKSSYQIHINFYEKPFANFVLMESIMEKPAPGKHFTSYRSIKMDETGTLDTITVTNELKTFGQTKVLQKEDYVYKDFKVAQKMKDNYLEFYGLAEPSFVTQESPWYKSTWFLSGSVLAIFGGSGLWYFRNSSKE